MTPRVSAPVTITRGRSKSALGTLQNSVACETAQEALTSTPLSSSRAFSTSPGATMSNARTSSAEVAKGILSTTSESSASVSTSSSFSDTVELFSTLTCYLALSNPPIYDLDHVEALSKWRVFFPDFLQKLKQLLKTKSFETLNQEVIYRRIPYLLDVVYTPPYENFHDLAEIDRKALLLAIIDYEVAHVKPETIFRQSLGTDAYFLLCVKDVSEKWIKSVFNPPLMMRIYSDEPAANTLEVVIGQIHASLQRNPPTALRDIFSLLILALKKQHPEKDFTHLPLRLFFFKCINLCLCFPKEWGLSEGKPPVDLLQEFKNFSNLKESVASSLIEMRRHISNWLNTPS